MFPVAVEAPAHGEWRDLFDAFHLFDRPVASLTSDPGEDMLAMVEVHKVRKIVDSDPSDWPPLLDGLFELLDLARLDFEQRVAVHAHARWRDSRVATGARGRVTI
jgi:hypothetical protein